MESLQPELSQGSGRLMFETLQSTGPSAEELQIQHEAFLQSVEIVSASQISDDQRQVVQKVADIFEWFHFGEPGMELPEALVNVMDEDTGIVYVRLDCTNIPPIDLRTAWWAIQESSTTPITGQIPERAKFKLVAPTISSLLQETPGYKLVQSIITEAPVKEQTQSLTQAQRHVREAQIRAEVRARNQLGENDRVEKRSPADLDLQGSLYRLDEETVRRPSEDVESGDTFRKIRAFFKPHIMKELQESIHVDMPPITHYSYDEEGEQYIGWYGDTEAANLEDNELLLDLTDKLNQTGTFSVPSFYTSYIEKICNAAHMGRESAQAQFEMALAAAADYTAENLCATPMQFGHDRLSPDCFTERAFLYGLQGEIVPNATYETWRYSSEEAYAPAKLTTATIGFVTYAELQRKHNESAGFVTRRDPTMNSAVRLIQTTTQKQNLPQYATHETLHIAMENWSIAPGEQIYVPGFTTVSFDPFFQEWGLAPDVNGDPYAPAEVAVPEDRKEGLLSQYEDIGLTELAQTLRDTPRLTVNEMTQIIQRYTNYSVPARAQRTQEVGKLYDFGTHVQGQKLNLQCTGSAAFLVRSLNEVFGVNCAAVQQGRAIQTTSDLISQLEHQQVSFTHVGQTFLLDSTGFSTFTSSHANNTATGTAPSFQPTAQRAKPKTTQQRKQVTFDLAAENAAHPLNMFVEQLIGMYGVANSAQLYETIARLPIEDPVRITLSNLMGEHTSVDDLHKNKAYLEAMARADEATLRGAKLRHYLGHHVLNVALDSVQAAIVNKLVTGGTKN